MPSYTIKQVFDGYLCGHFGAADVLLVAGVPRVADAAAYLGINRRTVERWIAANKLPGPVLLALRYRAGDLSGIGGADVWRDWQIIGDVLHSPYGPRITRRECLTHGQLIARVYALERARSGAGAADDCGADNVVPLFPRRD